MSILLGVHLSLALLSFEPQPHTGGDNAAYVTLGRSLLERHAYLELWEPGEPAHTKYPPVFPLLLALAMAAGLQPWAQLKLVTIAAAAGAIGLSFLWLRRRGRTMLGLGVATLLALSPGVLLEARWILSDVPFWGFTLLALWGFERLRPDDWRRFALAAAAVLCAYFTRSAGLPLLLAALGWLAWRRHWRQLAILIALTLPLALLWWLRTRTAGPAGYVSEFWMVNPYAPELGRIGLGDLAGRVVENARKYVSLHLPILLAGRPGPPLLAISVPVAALAVYGWIRRLRRAQVSELFLPLYLGLILIWPAVWSGERFLLPVLPLLLAYAGAALRTLTMRVAPARTFAVGAAALVFIVIVAAPATADLVRFGRMCSAVYRTGERYPCTPAPMREYFAIAEWSRDALPPDAVVLSRKPRLFYALGERRGRVYPFSQDPAVLLATADSLGARYVVLDHIDRVSQAYLTPVLLQRPDNFCVLFGIGQSGTTVFGILPPAERVDVAPADAESPSFRPCEDDYWRSAEARRRLTGS